jgi:predicted MFS family arabinose efflux permease
MGWRNVFLIASGVGLLALIWQWIALPSLKPLGATRLRTTIDVIRVPGFAAALFAISFVFCGRFASFTYLRPFLEQTTHANANWVSIVLFVFGLSYFVGNSFAPGMIRRDIRRALFIPPVALAAIAVGLLLLGQSLAATVVLVFLWGAFFGPVAPGWSTWVARKVPEQAETGGGLYVAAVQFAAAIGASVGGLAFDFSGSKGVFILSGAAWALSAVVVSRMKERK